MSDQPDPAASSASGYPGPPVTGYPGPPVTGRPPAGQSMPYGAPAYPPPYGPPWYPPAGYGGGHPAPWYPGAPPVPDPRDLRPSTLTAAAVLGYVNAGFMIICGLLLFAGASIAHDIDNYNGDNHTAVTTELTIDAVLNLIAAGLLIGGAVALTNGSAVGRVVHSVGSGLVIVMSAYWSVRFDDVSSSPALFWALLFGAIAVVGLAMAWVPSGTAWLRRPRA